MSWIAGRFSRVEPRHRVRRFASGLLADLPHKNCWTLAERAGDTTPDGSGYPRWSGVRHQAPTRGPHGRAGPGRGNPRALEVAGDEVYGDNPYLRTALGDRRTGYVLRCLQHPPRHHACGEAPGEDPGRAHPRAGAKGERLYDWAQIVFTTPTGRPGYPCMPVRRSGCTGELAFYRCFPPGPAPLAESGRVVPDGAGRSRRRSRPSIPVAAPPCREPGAGTRAAARPRGGLRDLPFLAVTFFGSLLVLQFSLCWRRSSGSQVSPGAHRRVGTAQSARRMSGERGTAIGVDHDDLSTAPQRGDRNSIGRGQAIRVVPTVGRAPRRKGRRGRRGEKREKVERCFGRRGHPSARLSSRAGSPHIDWKGDPADKPRKSPKGGYQRSMACARHLGCVHGAAPSPFVDSDCSECLPAASLPAIWSP